MSTKQVAQQMFDLAMWERSGSTISSCALLTLTHDMVAAIRQYDAQRIVNPDWIEAWRQAHAHHPTITFNARFCAPAVYI